MKQEHEKQAVFNQEYEAVIGPIETDLRKKKHLLIDQKSIKSIKNKQVSYKLYDESNALAVQVDKDATDYEDRDIDPETRELDQGIE